MVTVIFPLSYWDVQSNDNCLDSSIFTGVDYSVLNHSSKLEGFLSRRSGSWQDKISLKVKRAWISYRHKVYITERIKTNPCFIFGIMSHDFDMSNGGHVSKNAPSWCLYHLLFCEICVKCRPMIKTWKKRRIWCIVTNPVLSLQVDISWLTHLTYAVHAGRGPRDGFCMVMVCWVGLSGASIDASVSLVIDLVLQFCKIQSIHLVAMAA